MKKQVGDTMWLEMDDVQTIGPFKRSEGWTKFPVRLRHWDGEVHYTTLWPVDRVLRSLGLVGVG